MYQIDNQNLNVQLTCFIIGFFQKKNAENVFYTLDPGELMGDPSRSQSTCRDFLSKTPRSSDVISRFTLYA